MENLILNRYRPLGEAGRGGYGVVQVAWDTRIQRRVAIKMLHWDPSVVGACEGPNAARGPYAAQAPGAAYDARQAPRDIPGLAEARTAALLSGDHIVGVYDFEVDYRNATAYLIMEYVDGITLTDLMREFAGPLPLNIATCVFDAVADALAKAHANQVLHLDIKPDNVLINRQGQVKVSDFGLAQLSCEAGYGQAAGGTIGYMPLEQMRLEAPDTRTDEWALAALTYEMLTGDNPFVAETLHEAETAIEEAELVIPSVVRDDVDEEADEAIFGALAIERDYRFDSVALFADALMPHLGDARRGMRELAVLVGEACDDAEEEDVTEPMPRYVRNRVSLMDRLGERAQAVLFRLWAAAACGFVAFEAATNIPALYTVAGRETPAFWGVLLACIAAAGALPAAGAAVAIVALAAALFASGAYALGAAFLIAGGAWWAFFGRRGHAQAVTGVTGVALGAFGLGPLAPLLAGYFLRVPSAAATAAFSALTAFVLACSGSMSLTGWNVFVNGQFSNHMGANALVLLGDPSMWIQAVSWVASSSALALLCARGSKPWAVVGAVVAAALMLLGDIMGSAVAAGVAGGAAAGVATDWADIVPALIAPAIVIAAALAVGVPLRPEPRGGEDWDEGGWAERDAGAGRGRRGARRPRRRR